VPQASLWENPVKVLHFNNITNPYPPKILYCHLPKADIFAPVFQYQKATLEGWIDGMVEWWKSGRLEKWKNGRME
jgi:hypothetical protein